MGQGRDIDTISEEELARTALEEARKQGLDPDAVNRLVHEDTEGKDKPPAADPPEGGQSAGDGPGDSPAGGDGNATPSGDVPESGLLKRLRDQGWDHTFKTEDEALEGLVQLRRFAGTKLENEALGRLAREAGMTPDQLEASRKKQDDDPYAWNPPVKFDPTWDREIKVKEDGSFTGPEEKLKPFLQFERYRQDYWARLGNDPLGLVRAGRSEIAEMVRDELARARAVEMSQSFLKEHGALIRTHQAEFEDLLGRGMDPNLAIEHLSLKHAKGEKPDAGQDAKNRDLKKLKEAKRGKAPEKEPQRAEPEEEDLSELSEEEIARLSLKEKGIDLSKLLAT